MALVNKAFSVSVTPGAMPPVVHVSEYDIGRSYTVTINGENGEAFTIPTGATASVEGTLNGKVGFTESATIDGNTVSFSLTESMTAYSGKAWCKVKLVLNDEPIQTCAFVLAVDRAGVEADTVIGAPGFEEQIEDAVADYLQDFAIDDEVVRDAVDDYLDENGIDTESITTATTDWLSENVTPVGSAVVVDSSLSVEGAAADAKATGEIKSYVGVLPEFEPVYDAQESDSVNIIINDKLGSSGFVPLENFNPSTGVPGTVSSGARTIIFPVKPGSTIHTLKNQGMVLFDDRKNYVSGFGVNISDRDTVIPDGVYYAGISSNSNNFSPAGNMYFQAKTNCWVRNISFVSDSLKVDWDNVQGQSRSAVDESVEIANRTFRAFQMYDFAIHSGQVVRIAQGKYYSTNPYGGNNHLNGYGAGNAVFYNANMEPILFPSTDYGMWGGFRTRTATTTPTTVGNQYFKVDGNIVTGYQLDCNPRTYSFELPETPVFLKFSFSTGGQWVVGDKAYYRDEIQDGLQWVLYDEENNTGLFEQIQNYVVGNIISSVTTSELGRWMRFNAIQQSNKMRHAWRVASFNTYGTGGAGNRNWTAIKELLQECGIDMIGFQEVNNPNVADSSGKTFEQALTSWHLSQFGVIQTEAVPTNCRPVATTGEFEVVSITETKYTTQSNYGNRYFTRTEAKLPRWKDKKASENFKVSIYNTQLEVGTSAGSNNTRLAQAAQLVAAMNADTNPFVILVGDFNEMSVGWDVVNAFKNAGYTPQLEDTSTPTAGRGFYDFIFVNERISLLENDVVPCDLHYYYPGGVQANISDHDLVFADVVFDYENLISVKTSLPNCTLSGGGYWLDRRQTEAVVYTVTPDEGYTVQSITTGQGDNDLTYSNGAVVKSGNTVTIKPNLVVGDVWINVTTAAAT